MYYVYIIENRAGGYYIGSCENVELRITKHNSNSVRSTKNKGPYRLVYKEPFDTRTLAIKREHQIKGHKGNSQFKKLLNNFVPIV